MFDNFVMLSINLTYQYSRAKMSCCLVSADPLVGKKFSSSNETCKIMCVVIFYKILNLTCRLCSPSS